MVHQDSGDEPNPGRSNWPREHRILGSRGCNFVQLMCAFLSQCLDVANAASAAKTPIQLFTCGTAYPLAQQWNMYQDFTIRSGLSSDKLCLGVDGGMTRAETGSGMMLVDCETPLVSSRVQWNLIYEDPNKATTAAVIPTTAMIAPVQTTRMPTVTQQATPAPISTSKPSGSLKMIVGSSLSMLCAIVALALL